MSDHIPFDIQSEIIKRLPVKSIVQFRSVSKQWKSFIDCPDFIKTYHINHQNLQRHLIFKYELNNVTTYTSIIDDDSFPKKKFPQTAPEPLNILKYTSIIGCVDGLLCFYGLYKVVDLETYMVVLWNISIRKSVGIPIPDVNKSGGYIRIGFGVCPETSDPKLVKINVVQTTSICWEVQVFTLSSRVWKTVYTGAPFKSCGLMWGQVFIDGIIYWRTSGSSILYFDLKSEKFGEVCLPEGSVSTYNLRLVKVNESLGLLEYDYQRCGMSVCGVWMKDGVNHPFTKIYTISVGGKLVSSSVLWFRNNGEVVLQLDDDDGWGGSQIKVYEPSSRRINSVGIRGDRRTFTAWSYMETLLLLDQPNSIIQ